MATGRRGRCRRRSKGATWRSPRAGLDALERDLKALIAGGLAKLEKAFATVGAPWSPGRREP